MLEDDANSMKLRYRHALHSEARGVVDGLAELDALGQLIDLAGELRRKRGFRRAVRWSERILQRSNISDEQRALVHYFVSNAWAGLRSLNRVAEARISWDQPEAEQEILHLRKARSLQTALDPVRRCQVHTNLGNALNARGRIVEAIEEWDAALAVQPSFGMALGNRGRGLAWYARAYWDPGHQSYLLHAAHRDLGQAAVAPDVYAAAREQFREDQLRVESLGDTVRRDIAASPFVPRKMAARESEYRYWCASERLFLSVLNELGVHPVVMADVLMLPTITTSFDEGPPLFGFFNQLKQEYVAARFLLYESIHGWRVHFADRDVSLVNTLDYPTYCLAAEQAKLAFRSAYSIFDKIAFFLNDYLKLGISERDVSFRRLWYDDGRPRQALRAAIRTVPNPFLQALFWLSKDFHETDAALFEIEPDARMTAEIRHELEHKYLKLHEMLSGAHGRVEARDVISGDRLAYSLPRLLFVAQTLNLLRRARAGLIYLTFAVRVEEQRRERARSGAYCGMPIVSDLWDDEWKR